MAKLILDYGNILDYIDKADVIVNSNNRYMISGSGVCGLIYKSAGKEELEKCCKDNFKEQMKVNEIRITKGFKLGIDIIHICCPKYYESKEPIKELLNGYENIFIIAKENNYKSILSVSIGSGINGYKHNEIADIIVSRLKQLVSNYNIDFHLILPNEEILELYKNKIVDKN